MTQPDVDVAVVGAGMAGLYLLKRLRDLGMTSVALEAADDVGGTWYWNRYPGARCDVQSIDYSYTWDDELEATWEWSEKYATQPEILRYLQHVADRHDLRRDIRFATKVVAAAWDDDADVWRVQTSAGDELTARHYVMATGCLSVPKEVDIDGTERFAGEVYFTSRWPHAGVDFTGKRVAVIGTGSSAIQSIPLIAEQATSLTVFQRTPNFSIPAHNGAPPPAKLARLRTDRAAYRHEARWSPGGMPFTPSTTSVFTVSEAERDAAFEQAWEAGGIIEFLSTFSDLMANERGNHLLAEFVRNKIRATVADPETAEALCPTTYPIGTKRLCVDTNYYQTFNQPHVRLVDLRKHPISTITEVGIDVGDESYEFDAIVFATGFDAMTGAIVNVDIAGRDGRTLKDEWAAGPATYLGLMTEGFPNLFMITGPGSPSVLANMAVAIEQHVEWVTDCLDGLRRDGYTSIEPTPAAVAGWGQHVNDFAAITLVHKANSWYLGANVPGKARVFLPYPGGVDRYRTVCDESVAGGYVGFVRSGPQGAVTVDGVLRELQPDVQMMLDMMAEMNLPALESLPVDQARMFMDASAATRAPGPDVGEIVDGVFPGAAGELAYRLYRPVGDGPHPVVVYLHGGGWVLGSEASDDPVCRDLCHRSGSLIVSVNYRHAPEARFPAAVDDAVAATTWVADHAAELGGIPGRVVVAGWSAGANLAAVVAQIARDSGGPVICGQLLMTPVTDAVAEAESYRDNADGYVLTAGLMRWFFDHYVDAADRADPRVSPLRAESLAGLPPAVVLAADFDPLCDEGIAYAEAMAAAGTQARYLRARGHTHTSWAAVDMLPSSEPVRVEIAAALRGFFA